MNKNIVATLPFAKIAKLVIDLITFAKDGYSKEEGKILLNDLEDIASHISKSLL